MAVDISRPERTAKTTSAIFFTERNVKGAKRPGTVDASSVLQASHVSAQLCSVLIARAVRQSVRRRPLHRL